MSNLRRVLALTVASACLFPGAAAAADWGPTTTLHTAPDAGRMWAPAVAADAAGNEAAVWRTFDGVYTSEKPAGGSWSAPVAIRSTFVDKLSLSIGANGHAVAAWIEGGYYASGSLVAATRTPAGVWSAPQTVRTDAIPAESTITYASAFGVGPSGESVGASSSRIEVGRKAPQISVGALQPAQKPLGGTWAAGPDFAGGSVSEVRLALDGSGNATLVYSPADGGLAVATRPAGGSWTTPTSLAEPGTAIGYSSEPGSLTRASSPQLSVNAAGQAVVVWERQIGADHVIQSVRRAANGTWSAVQTLTTFEWRNGINDLDAQIDERGRATAVWRLSRYPLEGDYSAQLFTSTAATGADWSAPVGLTPTLPIVTGQSPYRDLQLAVAGTDQAVATWSAAGGFEASVRTAGAAFAAPDTLAGDAADLGSDGHSAVEVTASGDATVLWTDSGRLQARELAGTTPVPTPQPKAEIAATLSAFGVSKCPSKADAWSSAPRVTLTVTRVGTGALRCRAIGTITLKAGTKIGSTVPVLVTGWGLWPALVTAKVVAG